MKKPAIIILVVVAALIAAAWMPVTRYFSWCHDYAEAEPLLGLIWPMAGEMMRFSTETGRAPASLEELDRFSTDHDFSPLAVYHPKFTPEGESLFHLEVNRRFSFEIDKSFTPKWARFTSVLGEPKQSSMGHAPKEGAAANRRPAGPSNGADHLSAMVAAARAFPAAVAELVHSLQSNPLGRGRCPL
ncbi:hypothetical protein AYO49_03205 [Verrucomicrobiaceae bacterium SCGC AG-212-N21]|nr:hypothetical protein AYO49_03205 [Verrucomicrobiaceae bacterium SCGC AG-212-N21]